MLIDPTAVIHPAADIEEAVAVGARTHVWARTHLRQAATVGADCTIGEGVYVGLGVKVGDRCKIQNLALLYEGSEVADDVFIGPSVCLTNDRSPRASTAGHGLKRPEDWVLDGVAIKQGASLGAGAVVVAGHRVGIWAMVGAGAIVTRDVPGHALVVGNPARRIGWVCRCGGPVGDTLVCPACDLRYVLGDSGLSLLM